MRVSQCLQEAQTLPISIEIEPPKIGQNIEDVFKFIDPLVDLGVQYIDITYHGPRIIEYVQHEGETHPMFQRLQPGTTGLAGAIFKRYQSQKVFPVPHMICNGFTKYDIEEILNELQILGVENILALRGDGCKDSQGSSLPFTPTLGGHEYAYELIDQVRQMNRGEYLKKQAQAANFCIGAACYPEGNDQEQSMDTQIEYMKKKVDAGCHYFVTQMFFDSTVYEKLVNKALQAGIHKPIVPGIKVLTKESHLRILPNIFYCTFPVTLRKKIEKHQNDPKSISQIGLEHCIRQCEDLSSMGSPSLHFYASRQAPIKEVLEEVKKGIVKEETVKVSTS